MAAVLAAATASVCAGAVQALGRTEGLPSSQVHALAQTPDGVLWIAGPSGLARYDGVRVTAFGKKDGLTTQGLRSLHALSDGSLFVGTDAGLDVRTPAGELSSATPNTPWTYGFVEKIVEAPRDGFWLATGRGLVRRSASGDEIRPARHPDLAGAFVADVIVSGSETWAAVPGRGLFRHDGAHWHRVDDPSISALGKLTSLAHAGGWIYAGGENGIARIQPRERSVEPLEVGPVRRVSTLAVHGGALWIGAMGDVIRVDLRNHPLQPTRYELSAGLVNDLFVDDLGNVWVGTDNRGIARLSVLNQAIRSVDQPCASQIYSIRESTDGGYLVAGDTCSWKTDASLTQSERLTGLEQVKVWDLLQREDGTIAAATELGVMLGSDGQFETVGGDSLALRSPARVVVERDRELYVGTISGLARIAADGIVDFRTADGMDLGYVYTLELDAQQRLWVGTIGNGLWRESAPGVVERVRFEHLDDQGNVYSLAFGSSGEMAIANDDHFVIVDASGVATRLDNAAGDPIAAWSVVLDESGHLWAGGSSGLWQYDLDSREVITRINSDTGLAGDEFTTSRSLALSHDTLLCGVERGLTAIDRARLSAVLSPPRLGVGAVRWTRARVAHADGGLDVAYGNWELQVELTAPWFLDEQGLTFRHRLLGFDDEWSDLQSRSEHGVHFTGLPPGEYALEVQAYSPMAGWSDVTPVMEFRVLRPWWARGWAVGLWLALACALLVAAWNWRVRVLTARAEELERVVAERTHELQRASEQLEYLATHDDLTGLPNRRTFWRRAQRAATRARRHDEAFGMILIDLDHFKKVNDTHGHAIGDAVLEFAARRLGECVRETDLLARYGGEEFIVLAHRATEGSIVQAAERLRSALCASSFEGADGIEIPVRASFGASTWRGATDDIKQLFARADAAVYEAKKTRDTVCLWTAGVEMTASERV